MYLEQRVALIEKRLSALESWVKTVSLRLDAVAATGQTVYQIVKDLHGLTDPEETPEEDVECEI